MNKLLTLAFGLLVSLDAAAQVEATRIIRSATPGSSSEPGLVAFSSGPLAPEDIETFSYPIPDFHPDMHGYMRFDKGIVWRSSYSSGNGNGTTLVDDDGVVWAEFAKPPNTPPPGVEREEPVVHHFVTAVNLENATGYLFLNERNMALNHVLTMMNSLRTGMYTHVARRSAEDFFAFRRAQPRHIPQQAGYDILVEELRGDWLTLEDIQERVFQQTRCHLELDKDTYYLAGCE